MTNCSACGNAESDTIRVCSKCGASMGAPPYAPASIWLRLANFFIDRFIVVFVLLAIDAVSIFAFHIISPWITVSEICIYFIYFVAFESIWQRTISKWITSTKVVMRDGSKPPFLNILGRSFARYIPFEPISFLFSMNPSGWHDRLSKTIVVPASYSADDVKKIDFEKIRKENGSNTVLVVILLIFFMLAMLAIIGILSSVVLVSLSTARNKGHDARIAYDLNWTGTQMETYYLNNGTYSHAMNCSEGMFKDNGIQSAITDILGQNTQSQDVRCYAEGTSYAISAPLTSSDQSYCLDDSGFTGSAVAVDANGSASCVAESDASTSMDPLRPVKK